MKFLLPILSFIFCSVVAAQSPFLTVKLDMDKVDTITSQNNFKIEMKMGLPKKKSPKDNWFEKDTSTINFSTLKTSAINFGNYMQEGDGIKLSEDGDISVSNSFKYGNILFAWEFILVFKITNTTSRTLQPSMYVIMPIKYKSFFSTVNIVDVVYKSGHIVFIDDAEATYPNQRLTINHSLKNESGTELKKSFYKNWVSK